MDLSSSSAGWSRTFIACDLRPSSYLFLVDPTLVNLGPAVDLLLLEPEGDLLLGGLDAVGAVADVAADVLGHTVSSLLLGL